LNNNRIYYSFGIWIKLGDLTSQITSLETSPVNVQTKYLQNQ